MTVRISSRLEDMKPHYTVVVVGSGYGGGIAASRTARAGQSVCVLERGKEFLPGEYPDTNEEAREQTQIDFTNRRIGSRTALFDMRVNKDVNVLVGCGLGGTSLINANVSLRADPRVYEDERWPQEIRDDVEGLLKEGYRRAEEMLKPAPFPDDLPLPKKTQALEKSAQYMGEEFYRVPINVNFEDRINHVGVEQQACRQCGDCVSGCNFSAKNTTLMNYLPDAYEHGAEIFTHVDVRRLERRDGRWVVHYQVNDTGMERFSAPTLFVTADIVVLAAGALGSTEILLRSKANGLPLSDRVGHGFSGNGDVLGFAYNNDVEINGVGFGRWPTGDREPVGPTITGIIDMRSKEKLDDGIVIQEGAIPGGIGMVLAPLFAAASKMIGRDTDTGVADELRELGREMKSLVGGPYRGAMRNTQTYLVMAHEEGAGQMHLENDKLRIDWPQVGSQPIFKRIDAALHEATKPLGGVYIHSPLWTRLQKHDLITVHPLGGAVMAPDASTGVVNHKGQVYSDTAGAEVYEDLYVSDGSIIPRPVGVNPLLTISALAERSCVLMARDRGWTIDYEFGLFEPKPATVQPVGVRFTERMTGFFSTDATDDFKKAYKAGKKARSPLHFTLTITFDDLSFMLKDPTRRGRMIGTVVAPALSDHALTVRDGQFNLFLQDPNEPDVHRMRYRMTLTSQEGRTFFFDGYKVIHDDVGFDMWADTTTLYITVHEGNSDKGPVVGRGMLRIAPTDFMRQLRTMEVLNAKSTTERLETLARFGRFFAGVLYDVYGSVFTGFGVLGPEAPPRKKRSLRAEAPAVHFLHTPDGVRLELTNFSGGDKGPVLLAHGLGSWSETFSIDTVESNLVEFLVANGYDVWLLDWRGSTELPYSSLPSTFDDVATQDWPAAVERVKTLTGAPAVQVVAHAEGAASFLMALGAGLTGVRSAVVSQMGTHFVLTSPCSAVFAPGAMSQLEVGDPRRYMEDNDNWRELVNKRLEELDVEGWAGGCDAPACRHIHRLYGEAYSHGQLNEATHDAVQELFDLPSLTLMQHLATLVDKGHLVSHGGERSYLERPERFAIPITLIHGEENAVFLPEGAEKTYEFLRTHNAKDLYERHLVPRYGHNDCLIGNNAVEDVYPIILDALKRADHSE